MYTANKIFIYTVIICAAVLAVSGGYKFYRENREKAAAAELQTGELFASIPSGPGEVTQAAPEHLAMPASGGIDYGAAAAPSETELNAPSTFDYMPDDALPVMTQDARLQARAQKVFDKYMSNPLMKQFNEDIQNAGMKGMDFSKLAAEDMGDVLRENPKLRDIFIKYSQNPQFIALIRQMGEDPEIQAVTQELKQENYER